MATTKPQWYFELILITVVTFVAFLNFGTELVTVYPTELTTDSYTYLDQYALYLADNGVIEISQENRDALKTESILEDEGAQSVTDFLATLNYYKSKVQKINNRLKFVYNLPSIFVMTAGLDITQWDEVLNAVSLFLFMGLVVLIIKLVRGS